MYEIDQTITFNRQYYDCLHYHVLDNIKKIHESFYIHQHQILPFCMRPSNVSNDELLLWENKPLLTGDIHAINFHELFRQGVNTQQLLTWSTSIDLVEQYQIYLNNRTMSLSQQTFYNCSPSWFGRHCQYKFLEKQHHFFDKIIKSTFALLIGSSELTDIRGQTCYVHLTCHRGPNPLCLDWREICDGKVDCLDGGQDEENCFDLEIHQCNENEYRCHNGMQCIPREFYMDDIANPDCTDRTDESDTKDLTHTYDDECYKDPSFRCEEHSCRPKSSDNFVCGDGTCVDENGDCFNGRGNMIILAMLYPQLNDDDSNCRIVMMCVTCRNCPDVCSSIHACARMIRRFCKQSLFAFPTYPVLFGHVRFIFSNNRSLILVPDPLEIDDDYILLLPDYLCYDKQLCDNITPMKTILFKNFTCLHLDSAFTVPDTYRWRQLIYLVKKYFYRCSTVHDMKNITHCSHESQYKCANSSKCISKYRLADSLQDCYKNDDETLTIVLNKPNTLINNSRVRESISFPILCDGYIDMKIGAIWNETDETDCNWWPCNNIYTRCNHIWNCHDGIDEINCPYLPSCPLSFHPCISPETFNLTCLSIDRAGNGIADCIGASDEPHMCRKDDLLYPGLIFRCRNKSSCLEIAYPYLCNGNNDCPLHDDELVCDKTYWLPCTDSKMAGSSDIIKFLCQGSLSKPKQIFLLLANLIKYPEQNAIQHHLNPSLTISSKLNELNFEVLTVKPLASRKNEKNWQCNRGIHVIVRQNRNTNIRRCLCPPAYYGNICQYQNQRVSMTLHLKTEAEWRTTFALVITLVDEQQNIESYEQIQYLAVRNCNHKFHINLLYSARPKNIFKNYSIRIDAYNKHTLMYRASWIFPIIFPFLPVYRIVTRLTIPIKMSTDCTLVCRHGHCIRFLNKNNSACQCDPGWMGPQCSIYNDCSCAPGALCLNSGWSTICLCPLNKFGRRCYLTRNICQPDTCNYRGQCIPTDERIAINNFTCICHEGFSGETCQHIDTKIIINFHKVTIPSSVLGHFIMVDDNVPHTRITMFKKISLDEESAVLYISNKFHLLFIQFTNSYYLTIAQEKPVLWAVVTTAIVPTQRCLHIGELFNSTVLEFSHLRRIKLYHLLCEQQSELQCFYDEILICLCTTNRFANCFDFNHNMTYNCQGSSFCENGAQCFQDKPTCPTVSSCICPKCFYGTYCQFSTAGIALSLDVLLGYKIRPRITFTRQSISIKISAIVVIIMFVLSLISSVFSIFTFQTETSRKVGCGLYLLSTSIISLLTMFIFIMKFFILIYTQIAFNAPRSFLLFNCISMDFLLRVLLSTGDWLNVCVAAERTFAAQKGVRFDKSKSKYIAKLTIIVVILFTTLTTIHDPLNRRLIEDIEEQRIWCTTSYSSIIRLYDSIILFIHFLVPLFINGISALLITVIVARQRSIIRTKQTYKEHLRKQFHQNKYLLIPPCILVLLALPRLVLSFLSNCMQSPRDPWRFLIGYFASFCPSVLTFVVFVLPSKIYREEFIHSIKRCRLIIYQHPYYN